MKYFFSGNTGIRPEITPKVAALTEYRLLSVHRMFAKNVKEWCEVSHHPLSGMKEVMLDSGAFTAFVRGHKVQLQELISIYDNAISKLNPSLQIWLINLDVIPGAPGRIAERKEIEQAMQQSDDNFKALKKRYGTRVLPVYHQTEGKARLQQIASMNDYIAMGFRQDFAEEDRIQHAQEALGVIALQKKRRLVHGLATTGYRMLARAPFDSVDSASWLYNAAMGGISFVSQQGEVLNLAISRESPKQAALRQHFNSLIEDEKLYILALLKEADITLEQIQSSSSHRVLFNCHQIAKWIKEHYRRPAIRAERGLFDL